jgi:hypothetical protein
MAEQLSAAAVPVFVADVKGDLSGLAAAGEADSAASKRAAELGTPFTPTFLKSKQGKQLQKQVTRGLFGLLMKQL